MADEGRTLFLLGSNDTFPLAIGDFIQACGGDSARLAFLLPGGELNDKLIPGYEAGLKNASSVKRAYYPTELADDSDPGKLLGWASGLVLGGGSSAQYFKRYATDPFKGLIIGAYQRGVPVMACCGSALIVGDAYPLYQEFEGGPLECRPSLGLLPGHILGVHFEKGKSLDHLVDNMARAGSSRGLGIGVNSWVVFSDGVLTGMSGDICMVTMTNPKKHACTIEEIHRA